MQTKNPYQNRVTRTKKLGKDALVQISVNDIAKRIFVDFSSADGRLKIQKSFQNNFEGKKEAKNFESSFKNLKDIKKYFGIL